MNKLQRSDQQVFDRMEVHLKAALSKCGETHCVHIKSEVYYETRSPVLAGATSWVKPMAAAVVKEECK